MITLHGPAWPSKVKLEGLLVGAPGDLVVCWGASGVPGALNSSRRLNAIEQLSRLADADIACPEFTLEVGQARAWVEDGAQVFGRRLYHTQGSDIQGPGRRAPARFRLAWLTSEWWSKVVEEVESEWRIHAFCGQSIARGLKVQVEPPWRRMLVRSRNNGWRLRHDIEPPRGLRNAAKQACEACGYDFAAVDILHTTDERSVVLELNKAPALSDYTATAYMSAIKRYAVGENNA